MTFRARIIWSRPTISSWASQYDDIVAQNWHDDIIVLWYLDLKLHTSCHSSSQHRYEIRQPRTCPVTSTGASLSSQYAQIGVGYRVGQGRGRVGRGEHCPMPSTTPPAATVTARGSGGIALQYHRWTEEAWELRRTTASRPWLQAYLSTPVLEKLALSWPAAVVTCVRCHVPPMVASCSPHRQSRPPAYNGVWMPVQHRWRHCLALFPMCLVSVIGANGYSDDIMISSWTLSRYRDPQKVHDSSPNDIDSHSPL